MGPDADPLTSQVACTGSMGLSQSPVLFRDPVAQGWPWISAGGGFTLPDMPSRLLSLRRPWCSHWDAPCSGIPTRPLSHSHPFLFPPVTGLPLVMAKICSSPGECIPVTPTAQERSSRRDAGWLGRAWTEPCSRESPWSPAACDGSSCGQWKLIP